MFYSHLIYTAAKNAAEPAERQIFFIPTVGSEEELVEAALVASLVDASPVGARVEKAARLRLQRLAEAEGHRLSSDKELRQRVLAKNAFLREGSLEFIERWTRGLGGSIHNHLRRLVEQVRGRGGLAIVVANEKIDLGVICFERG